MKLFKLILVLLILIIPLSGGFILLNHHSFANPAAQLSLFISHLKYTLNQNQFVLASDIEADTYDQNCTFFLRFPDHNQESKIILSLQTDSYFQIASLQKVLKMAKIKNKYLVFIDLSLKHPYATLQDN